MQVNTAQRELALKLVYYGPALSGKTTNLRQLHQMLLPSHRGHLMELPTSDDRTLFFDTLPLLFKQNGFKVKLRLFTVPGQVLHNSTRRIVLQGCDAVAFIADSQPYKKHDNYQYWANLEENLRNGGLTLDRLPHVVQWNKKDLGDETTAAAVAAMRRESRRPVFEAVAIEGTGVAETFLGLVSLLYETLDREQGLSALCGLTHAQFMDEVRRCFVQPPSPARHTPVPTPGGGVPRLGAIKSPGA